SLFVRSYSQSSWVRLSKPMAHTLDAEKMSQSNRDKSRGRRTAPLHIASPVERLGISAAATPSTSQMVWPGSGNFPPILIVVDEKLNGFALMPHLDRIVI